MCILFKERLLSKRTFENVVKHSPKRVQDAERKWKKLLLSFLVLLLLLESVPGLRVMRTDKRRTRVSMWAARGCRGLAEGHSAAILAPIRQDDNSLCRHSWYSLRTRRGRKRESGLRHRLHGWSGGETDNTSRSRK